MYRPYDPKMSFESTKSFGDPRYIAYVIRNIAVTDPETGNAVSRPYDDVVYVIDTVSGEVKSIPVGREPHGLTVWPQPGRYSLGHTGNMR